LYVFSARTAVWHGWLVQPWSFDPEALDGRKARGVFHGWTSQPCHTRYCAVRHMLNTFKSLGLTRRAVALESRAMRPAATYLVLLVGLASVAAIAAGCAGGAPSAPPAGDGKPLRILSLGPNVTEILFAMDLGRSVVGRSTYCTYPPEAQAIPAVGDTMQLNLEQVIRLEPTVAFIITRRDEVPRRIEGLGVRCVSLQSDRMSQMLEAIRTIGRETGRQVAAQTLLDRIQADLGGVRRSVAGLPRPKVLFAFPMTVGSSRIMVAGRGTFVGDLLDVAGAENAYPETTDWPTVGPQQVVALAPEVVIINATGEDAPPDRVAGLRRAWAGLTSVPAVARDRVHILTEPCLTIPGPRIGQAARLLAQTIHPELRGAEKGAKP
jgi:iron complex transport system substrate-binding protein